MERTVALSGDQSVYGWSSLTGWIIRLVVVPCVLIAVVPVAAVLRWLEKRKKKVIQAQLNECIS